MLLVATGRERLVARPSLLANSQSGTGELLIVRVYYDKIDDLAALQSFDVWEYNNLQERYVLAAVDRAGYEALVNEGWVVAIDPVQQLTLARRASDVDGFYGGYRTITEIQEDLVTINSAAPDLTEIVTYGESHCLATGGCQTPGGDNLPGYPLLALRITNEHTPGSSTIQGNTVIRGEKPVFFLMANIHAREISTPEIALRFIAHLIDGYNVDADATWLIDHREIWVVPTANPDGYRIVELGLKNVYPSGPFYQRKNANNDADQNNEADCPVWPPSSYEQYGIDLNRNHSFGWGPPGSSDQPCELTYRGPSAASEVEVRALEDLVRDLIPDQRAAEPNTPAPADTTGILITLHSFSNLVLWPWGNTEMFAPNRNDLKAMGDKLASYNNYLSCQPTHCLYATNGSTDDWAYGELGIPAFTFEIGNQFMPAFSEIDTTQWPENKPALIYAAKIAHTPYQTTHGPDSLALAIAEDGHQLTISSTIDDRLNGGQPISAAAYSIDDPPELEGAMRYPLTPADGAFDSPVEVASGTIDLSGIPPGRHILFVHGQDSKGNWGATSATFIDVESAWTLEKKTLHTYLPPGSIALYQINVGLVHGGSDQNYTLAIEDKMPANLMILPATIMVNGNVRPDLYDAINGKLRFETEGAFENELFVAITFSAEIDKHTLEGSYITNTATAEATLNGETLAIPPASATITVSSSASISLFPAVIAP